MQTNTKTNEYTLNNMYTYLIIYRLYQLANKSGTDNANYKEGKYSTLSLKRPDTSFITCWWRIAGGEGVADQSGLALAVGPVPLDRAGGPGPADPGAWVHALVIDAGSVHRTVGVDRALGFAFQVGVAEEAGQAGAGGGPAPVRADGVDAAGRGSARVNRSRSCGYK